MNTDTFESLAKEIETYAREYMADPTHDPDGDDFGDGLATFEERAMALYNRYREAGVSAFRRPRKSFAALRRALAEGKPEKFDIPTVAQGKHGSSPPQWAIEDACACRVLEEMAASLLPPVMSRDATSPTAIELALAREAASLNPVSWCVLSALSSKSAPSIKALHERANPIAFTLNGVDIPDIDWFRQHYLDTMRRSGLIEKIGKRKGYCITDNGHTVLTLAEKPSAAARSTPR